MLYAAIALILTGAAASILDLQPVLSLPPALLGLALIYRVTGIAAYDAELARWDSVRPPPAEAETLPARKDTIMNKIRRRYLLAKVARAKRRIETRGATNAEWAGLILAGSLVIIALTSVVSDIARRGW